MRKQTITLSEAIAEYIAYARLELGHSPLTVEKRLSALRHFARFLQRQGLMNPSVSDIDLPICRAFLAYLVDERKICAKSIRGYMESLRVLYSYLQEFSYVGDSPVHRLRMPKASSPHRALVSAEELVRMFEALQLIRNKRRRYMAGAILAVYTYGGLRTKEVLALKLSDVSFSGEDCVIQVTSGKGDKRRVVPMHREGKPFLSDYIDVRGAPGHDFLFYVDKRRGIGFQAVHSIFNEVKWLARIDRPDLKPHALRHAYATRLLSSNVNLYHIQQLLGHSEVQTTINYLHSDLGQLTEAAQKGGLFNQDGP